MTEILTSAALNYLRNVDRSEPFFLTLSHLAPKHPATPQPSYAGTLNESEFNLPANYHDKLRHKPDYLKDFYYANDTNNLRRIVTEYHETIVGLDHAIGEVFALLDSMNLMDSTLIIAISDNGFMYGDNHLWGKRIAYEASINASIMMRYPPIIDTPMVVRDNIALNLDIAQTLYHVVGIDSIETQGESLIDIAKGAVVRDKFMYTYEHDGSSARWQGIPSLRAVRTLNYKYIRSYCDTIVEELYDLRHDYGEQINLIGSSAFDSIHQTLSTTLDSLRLQMADTLPIPTIGCALIDSFCCEMPTKDEMDSYVLGQNLVILEWVCRCDHSNMGYKVRIKNRTDDSWTNMPMSFGCEDRLVLNNLEEGETYYWQVLMGCDIERGKVTNWSPKDSIYVPSRNYTTTLAQPTALNIVDTTVSASVTPVEFQIFLNEGFDLLTLTGQRISVIEEPSTVMQAIQKLHMLDLSRGLYVIQSRSNAGGDFKVFVN